MHQTALDSAALRVQAEQIADAYLPQSYGRPGLLEDPDKVQLLLASLQDGNYRNTACRIAGIATQTFYNSVKRAEAGDVAAIAFMDAVEKAEAIAEAHTVRNVRKASELPQFWAAGMTWLERKSPDKWGRRNEDSGSPKIVVQIGVKDGDVQVTFASPASTVTPDSHSLTGDHGSDNGDYGIPATAPVTVLEAQPAGSEPPALQAGRTVAHPRPSRRPQPSREVLQGKASQEVLKRKRRPGGLRKKKG